MIDSTFKEANILIVDDQQANIDVLEGLLELQGYIHVKSLSDPRQVMEQYHLFKPDLILLDLSMPHLSGFEVMKQLNEVVPAQWFLPILVLTADVTPQAKTRALSEGASDFLTKPFDLIEVGLRIRNLLQTAYLQQQLQNQNLLLEEKVNERTQELVRKNKELVIARDKAEASDRLKSSFINNISHEIRTPLSGILGFGTILTHEELPLEEKAVYLDMLNESISRLINTVTNMMDISMVSSGNQKVIRQEIQPDQLIAKLMERFQLPVREKNLTVNLNTPVVDNGLKAYSDHELLSKVLFHLIDNAVKFTPEGSIEVGYEIQDQKLEFYVKDTGIGIGEENHQKVFESFFQEDNSNTRKFEGSGLGLSITKGIIDLLDGKIRMESQQGKGSVFYFSLECLEPFLQETGVEQRTFHAQDDIQYVLVVEDDSINMFYLSMVLKDPHIEIIKASNGWEAIDKCHSHPEIRLVLMDLKMPEMDGFEATRQIKALRKELPVIALTAYSENEERQKAAEAGCDDFITKPFNKENLLSKLKNYGLVSSV